jgi:hypothetical protein
MTAGVRPVPDPWRSRPPAGPGDHRRAGRVGRIDAGSVQAGRFRLMAGAALAGPAMLDRGRSRGGASLRIGRIGRQPLSGGTGPACQI